MTIESDKNKTKEDPGLEQKGVLLSGNELKILRFINEFGFCEIKQIIKLLDVKKTVAYSHMQILMMHGLVGNVRVIKYQPRAYYVTARGIDLIKLDLPRIRKIPLSVYEHQLAVIDVYLTLRKIYPETIWITERRLLRDKYASGSNKNEHLPDAAIVFPEGYQCAIEVERSSKTRSRLEEILLGYGLQQTYKEVWYFCAKGILPAIKEFASDMPYIKIHNMSEFLI